MLWSLKKFTESSLIAPKDKYAYISQSDVFIGRSDGINEKGLFVAMSFVNGTKTQPGIGFHFLVRKILEDCDSTEQAIQVIQKTTVASTNNFLLADAIGNIAVVESAPEKSVVRYPKSNENFIYITNQFVTEEMAQFDKGGVEWSKSKERYQGLQDRLAIAGHMNLSQAKEILADKCVCLHLKKEQFGTIWSVVANLNELVIERAETKPTLSNFKPETRLDWWLKKRVR
jgi:predicted choloylglycine hydrolase